MIKIPVGKYHLINKLSPAKISYDNSVELMDFRLAKRKRRKRLVERGVVKFIVRKDCNSVGVYVHGSLVSLQYGRPEPKEIDSIFDTVMAMEEHYESLI